MKLTEKELIKHYKYVYLFMNVTAYHNYLIKLLNESELCNKDFYIKIFTDYNFYNNPNFSGLSEKELLNIYKNITSIKNLYSHIKRTFEKRLKEQGA